MASLTMQANASRSGGAFRSRHSFNGETNFVLPHLGRSAALFCTVMAIVLFNVGLHCLFGLAPGMN
jgi:hypothetical protein